MNRQWLIALSQSLGRKPASGAAHVTDGELLKKFQETHDQEAFSEIVRRNGPMVWAVCRQLLPNRADAEDGVQSTFLALVQSANSIRKNASPGAWLYGVAVRVATKIKRSGVRSRQREKRVAKPEVQIPTVSSDWTDSYELVHEEILKLPDAMRTAFILCEIQNIPSNEAAIQLGCSANALAARLSKARRKLMAALSKKGIVPAVVAGLLGIGSTASSAGLPNSLFNLVHLLPVTELHSLPAHIVKLSTGVIAMSYFRTKIVASAVLLATGIAFSFGVTTFANSNASESRDTPAAVKPSTKDPVRPPIAKTETIVTGKVLLPDGKPAVGAIVWAAKRTHSPLIRKETITNQTGAYELKLDEGFWFLWARSGMLGCLQNNGDLNRLEITPQMNSASQDFKLEERGIFKGKLFEAESNKPVVGAKVFLDYGVVLTSDANGAFEIGGMPRAYHEGFVVAPGRLRQRFLFDTTAQAVTDLEIPVAKGVKIVGWVTDQAGKPIPGAWVGRATSGRYSSTNALYQECNIDGTFEYDGVALERQSHLTAGAPDFEKSDIDSIPVNADHPARVEFKLNPIQKQNAPTTPRPAKSRIVSGIVRAPDGKPLHDVLVRWGHQSNAGSNVTRTDAKGFYKLAMPDDWSILAILPKDYLPEFPHIKTKNDTLIDVTLKVGNTAKGIVVDEEGKPIAGVSVTSVINSPDPALFNSYWLTESQSMTDALGRFELKGVPDQAKFDVLKSGMSDRRMIDLNLNGAENKITMQYGGAIKGKFVDVNGKPIRNFRVKVNYSQEQKPGDQRTVYFAGYSSYGVRYTSDDGSFVLTGVGAGSVYRIMPIAEGHGEAVIDRVVAIPLNHLEKTPATIFKAEPLTQLKIKLVNIKGEAIPNASITLINGQKQLDEHFSWGYDDDSWDDMARMRTDAKGVADFSKLSFTQATIAIQAPGMARFRTGWRNRDKEREIVMQPESVLNGTVTFPKERFKDGFTVTLITQSNRNMEQVTAFVLPKDQGKFRIEGLSAGKWTVTMNEGFALGGRNVSATIELKPGETNNWQYEWTVEK